MRVLLEGFAIFVGNTWQMKPFVRIAMQAAVAARAAYNQWKFWEFHRALLVKQASLSDDTIQAIGTLLVLDMTKFNKDMDSQEIKVMVDRDLSEGRQPVIKVTPTVFVIMPSSELCRVVC